MDILDEHKSILISNGIYREENRICGGERCLRDSSIEHNNTLYANAAGLPHIRIHDFRHTHASVLINEWISIQEIARRSDGKSNGIFLLLSGKENRRAFLPACFPPDGC